MGVWWRTGSEKSQERTTRQIRIKASLLSNNCPSRSLKPAHLIITFEAVDACPFEQCTKGEQKINDRERFWMSLITFEKGGSRA
ncbi:MAG: hypothetical protein CL912_20905 [Deltaproteobacteria bacterium]|nr:hypothetical protein [Deltaproteobacteria bacterium]